MSTDAKASGDAATAPDGKDGKDSELSFEMLMAEIDRLTAQLERGDIPLEDALRAFERGMTLSKHAATMLDSAESRLVRLMEGGRGEVREVPLDLGDGDA